MSFIPIEEALTGFMQPLNETRKKFEEYLNQVPNVDFIKGIEYFLSGMELEKSELSQLAAIYLTKQYFDDSENLEKMSVEVKEAIITKVFNLFKVEKSLLFLQRNCEILVQALSDLKREEELMKIVESLFASSEKKLKLTLCYLIEIICNYSFDDNLKMKYANGLNAVFSQYLEDSNIEVRVQSLKSMSIFLESIDDENILKQFASHFPFLISKCIEAVKEDEEAGKIAIGSLIELLTTHPKFIKPIINELLTLFTEIIECTNFNDGLRIQALGGIELICSQNQVAMRKNDMMKARVIPDIYKMMAEVESISIENWDKDIKDETLSKNDPATTAGQTLYRISPHLTVQFIFPLLIPSISESLQSSEWKFQHAALNAVSMLSDGCADYFRQDLDNIMGMVSSLANSENPRIIYDILYVYAFLCKEFSPDIQTKHHATIMNVIMKGLKNSYTKVQYRAVQALVDFARPLLECQEERLVLNNYTGIVLSEVVVLFQKGLKEGIVSLLEETLSCISTLCATLDTDFAQFYPDLMPGMIKLLNDIQPENPVNINIRILAIQCMGYLLNCIRTQTELFTTDSNAVMTFLIQMIGSDIKDDDPHVSSILIVFSQVAECLGKNFAPYMEHIFPRLMRSITLQIEVKIVDVIDGDDDDDDMDQSKYTKKTVDLNIHGGKQNLIVNTAMVEQKDEGAIALEVISRNLAKNFYSYIEKTLPIVLKNFEDTSSQVQESSIKTVINMMNSCEKEEDQAKIFDAAFPSMLTLCKNAIQIQKDALLTKYLREIINGLELFSNPLMNLNFVLELLSVSSTALELCKKMKLATIKAYKEDEEGDETTQEKMDQEIQDILLIMQGVMEVSGYLIKLYRTNVENVIVNNLAPSFLATVTAKSAMNSELIYGLCFFDELLEYCSEGIFARAAPDLLNIFINFCLTSDDTTILQNCSSGIGIIAKRSKPEAFGDKLENTLKGLSKIVQNPKNLTQNKDTYESAIGAIGRMALFQVHSNQNLREQLLSKFLSSLPLKHDSTEAQTSHKFLLEEIANKNPVLVNSSPEIQNMLLKAISDIKISHYNNPENIILDEKGVELINLLVQ